MNLQINLLFFTFLKLNKFYEKNFNYWCSWIHRFSFIKDFLKNTKHQIIGIDNINNYYSVKLKKNRLKKLKEISKDRYRFYKIDICDKKIKSYFWKINFKK